MSNGKIVQFPNAKAVPEAARQASYELMAYTLRSGATEMRINLQGLTVEGAPIGDWEIIIRKVTEE